jgi:hypothetical protein
MHGQAIVVGLAAGALAAAVLSADTHAGHSTIGKAPTPAILTQTESSAEDLVDLALAGDRNGVIGEAARLARETNRSSTAALIRLGAPRATVARLRQRASHVYHLARSGSFVEILLAANAVSQLMPTLFGHFSNRVPTPILALDYFDREAEFRSLAREPEKVASAVKGIEQTWAGVRPKVIAAGGASEAAAYETHVATMKRLEPSDGRMVQAEARRGLELVDALERVFT